MPKSTDEEMWALLKSQGWMTDEEIAAAKESGKDPTALANAAFAGGDPNAAPEGPAQAPKTDKQVAKQERDEASARQHLKDQGWNDYRIDEAMKESGGRSATDIVDEMLEGVTTGPGWGIEEQIGSGEDILAERLFEHGGDKAQTYDAEGKVGDPIPKKGLPPGYKQNLELIDWLKTQTPTAEELQYEAPTYTEESLGLPGFSEAGQAFADPTARAAQYGTIARMQDAARNRGMGPEDILALTRISQQAEDTRLSGERGRQRDLQSRGMVAGGGQLAGNLAQGNRIRGAVQQARGDVVSDYAGRGQRAVSELGQYGGTLGRQTFGEQYERGGARDMLARANAGALVRRGEDVRSMSNRAEKQRARSGLQASAMRASPASAYLNMYQNEAGTRLQEKSTEAAIDRENAIRAGQGPGAWDWIMSGGQAIVGAVGTAYGIPGSEAMLASGVEGTVGNIEGETNKQKEVKKLGGYSYG